MKLRWIRRIGEALTVSPETLAANPVLAAHSISPQRVCEVAGVQRLAEIGPRNALVVSVDELAEQPEQLITLRRALGQGVLILFVAITDEFEHRLITESLDGLAVRVDEPTDDSPDALYAVRVTSLLERSLHRNNRALSDALCDMPTHRTPQHALALIPDTVPVRRVGWLRRALLHPSFPVYLIVFVYSALRVLPVAFISQFQGSLLVLWLIDVVTAVPYTWGVLAMLFAQRLRIRMIATVTTIVTFIVPYVYFWMNGTGYPRYVPVVIATLTILSMLVETSKYVQEQRLRRSYRAVATSPVFAAAR